MILLFVGFTILSVLAIGVHLFAPQSLRQASRASALDGETMPLPLAGNLSLDAKRQVDLSYEGARPSPPWRSADHTLVTFAHPLNQHREDVPKHAWLWMMLFGIFYLIVRQLWVHVAIVAAVIVGCLAVAPWLLVVVGLPLWFFYIASAAKLIIANYFRRGWRLVALEEVTPELPGAPEGVA